MGWSPVRRHKFGYYLPADVYEAMVAKVVRDRFHWLDVGGGRSVFPDNPRLAKELVARCERLVAVDPSPNVRENEFAHETAQSTLEEYTPKEQFDLATMRMVVEHVADPESFVNALGRLVKPGGLVILLTVSLWSPVTVMSRAVPFKFHNAVKRLFWDTDEVDTFPVCYKMNSRAVLANLFRQAGFVEETFGKADDLSVFGEFKLMNMVELAAWKSLRLVGLQYPERCILGVYRRQGQA